MNVIVYLFVALAWLIVGYCAFVLVFGGICLLFQKDEPPKPRVPKPEPTPEERHRERMRRMHHKNMEWECQRD